MKFAIAILSLLALTSTIHAQDEPPSPIIFIYDASGSMWGQIAGKTKLEIANSVLTEAVHGFPENQQVGLVAYGHRRKGDCKDVETLVAADNLDKGKVTDALAAIKPLGKTPLAYSATQVISYLRESKVRATVILVTDGIEVCGGDICTVVTAAKEEGIDFRMHIVGFGLKEDETEQLKCAAAAGDGRYYDAADAGGLSDVIDEATHVTIDDPIDNFSIFALKNEKPIDAYVEALISGTNTPVTQTRTYADTGYLSLAPGSYDIRVKPLEGSKVESMIVPGIRIVGEEVQHKDVSFDGGIINVMCKNNGEGWDAVVHIFNSADNKKVTGGRTYGKVDAFELNPGVYDVQLKPLRVDGAVIDHRIENVEVIANQSVEVGHDFKTGIAEIGAASSSGLVDAVIKIHDAETGTSISSGRTYTSETNNPKAFILTPGSYKVTLDALGDFRGQRREFPIIIEQGKTTREVAQF